MIWRVCVGEDGGGGDWLTAPPSRPRTVNIRFAGTNVVPGVASDQRRPESTQPVQQHRNSIIRADLPNPPPPWTYVTILIQSIVTRWRCRRIAYSGLRWPGPEAFFMDESRASNWIYNCLCVGVSMQGTSSFPEGLDGGNNNHLYNASKHTHSLN